MQYREAACVAVKYPATPIPFAWIGRVPGACSGKHGPISSSSASINDGAISVMGNANSHDTFALALPSSDPVQLDGGGEADVDHGYGRAHAGQDAHRDLAPQGSAGDPDAAILAEPVGQHPGADESGDAARRQLAARSRAADPND